MIRARGSFAREPYLSAIKTPCYGRAMMTALFMGLIASSAFPIGVALGLLFRIPNRILASIVAFGAGVLVVALTVELMTEAVEEGSLVWSIAGLLTGSLIYITIDQGLERAAEKSPRRSGRDPDDVKPHAQAIPQTEEQATISGMAVLVGTVLDGVPENAAIGIGMAAQKGTGLGLVLLGSLSSSNHQLVDQTLSDLVRG